MSTAQPRHLSRTAQSHEVDVLDTITKGDSNTKITVRPYVCATTVMTLVHHLLAKTGCRHRAGLVRHAYRTGRASD